jgi:diaminopimelate decarboxylase
MSAEPRVLDLGSSLSAGRVDIRDETPVAPRSINEGLFSAAELENLGEFLSNQRLVEANNCAPETDRWREIVQQLTPDRAEDLSSFFIVDYSQIVRRMQLWRQTLPGVKPFYAVKCNEDPGILQILEKMGAGFDCASMGEFEKVLAMGVDPNRIIFANPCKQIGHIQAAAARGIRRVTFDNEYELPKLKAYWPQAEVLLRLSTDDSAAVCQFSSKFGASLDLVPFLLQQAKELGTNLVGVSFHVGSGSSDPYAFVQAAKDARWVFDEAIKYGFDLNVLDIGGGFPGEEELRYQDVTFDEIGNALLPYLRENFSGVEIIAEPGRYFATGSHTLVCNVFSKRVVYAEVPHLQSVLSASVPTTPERPSAFEDLPDKQNNDKDDKERHAMCRAQSATDLYGPHSPLVMKMWDSMDSMPALDGSQQTPPSSPRRARLHTSKAREHQYYVNDGVYHSFNCILYDHAKVYPNALRDIRGPHQVTTLFGPTCDALDTIKKQFMFPELEVGDWLFFTNFGAYTCAAGSTFNGFSTTHRYGIATWVPSCSQGRSPAVEPAANDGPLGVSDDEASGYDSMGSRSFGAPSKMVSSASTCSIDTLPSVAEAVHA